MMRAGELRGEGAGGGEGGQETEKSLDVFCWKILGEPKFTASRMVKIRIKKKSWNGYVLYMRQPIDCFSYTW